MNKIETIEYKRTIVPKFQSEGNAMQWVKPYAERLVKGIGVEVGVNRVEWMAFGETYEDFVSESVLNGRQTYEIESEYMFTYFKKFATNYCTDETSSFPIDPTLDKRWDATNFPVDCFNLDYIINSHILEHVPNVVETLEYWKVQNNRKHLHEFRPKQFKKLLQDLGFKNVFVSGTDLNNSFLAICNK